MVHQVVDVAGLELVEDGDGDGAIGKGRQEAHAPVRLVARADRHFVALLQAALLEGDVQLGHPARHVPVVERHALVVGQGGTVPVLPEAVLDDLVDGFEFHFLVVKVGFGTYSLMSRVLPS